MWAFLQPTFLWAGLAAVMPLILHLLARRRAVRIRFPTIRFLKVAQHRSSRRIRMENFLLWLLRTCLLLLLAIGFALPVFRSGRLGALGRVRRDVAIVWDVSASMSYESGSRRIWDDSREAVRQILAGLQPGDRVAIVLAADRPIPLVAQPNADLAFVESLVRQQTPLPLPGSLAPAVRAAAAALKESGRRERELYIVTDGQARAWEGFATATNAPAHAAGAQHWDPTLLGDSTAVLVVLLGAESPINATTLEAELQPGLLLDGQAAQLAIRTFRSSADMELALTVSVDGEEIARPIVPPGDLGGEVVAAIPPLSAGRHVFTIANAPDGFAMDDTFHMLVHVRDRVPVVCLGEDADLAFLLRALQPGERAAGFDVRAVSPTAWSQEVLQRAMAVFVCNAVPLPGPVVVDLERFLREGGLVVVYPGDRAGPADYAALPWLPAPPQRIVDVRSGEGRRTLRLRRPDDPVFDGLKLPPGVVPTLALRRYLEVGAPAAEAEVLVTMDGDVPFLLARRVERGRVVLFTVSADRSWSNWPLTPFYLPMAHQLARHGAARVREPLWVWLEPEVRLPAMPAGVPERLVAPDGTIVPVRSARAEGETSGVVEGLREAGIYSVEEPGGVRRPCVAVNLDRRESDLAPVDAATVPQRLGVRSAVVVRSREELGRKVEEIRVGRPMGEWILWLALCVGVAEFVFANRVSRRTAPRRMKWIVEPSGRVRSAESVG